MKTLPVKTGQINNNEVAIKLRRVHKSFRCDSGEQVKALAGVDMTINQSEFVTMIGLTGCGKTTLLNIIAGLEKADEGEIHLADDLRSPSAVSCVFQHYTLFPWRSVLGNVSFGPQMNGTAQRLRKQAAKELIRRVGLADFGHAYPHELSGGMRQRAAIAQALAIKPRLLLMDEPFGALDESTRKELQQMLMDLCRQQRITVLFVTHNIDEALVMGDRVLVFSPPPGKIAREFNILLPRPRNRTTEEFTRFFLKIRQTLTTDTT